MRNLFFCLVVLLVACDNTDKSIEQQSSKDSVMTVTTVSTEADSNCIHEEPAGIIEKNAFPNMSFELQPDKKGGIETVNFENGDKLTIKDWGCNDYILTFRFETNRFQSEPTNTGFWYKRTVTLLNEINKKMSDSPINIVFGTNRLMERIEEEVPNGYQNLAFNEELDFEDGDVRTFVRIDKVEQLSDKKFAIEITFSKGPIHP